MTLENTNGTFVFEKADDGTWQAASFSTSDAGATPLGEDETLNEAQVRSVLRRAASVTMRNPLGKEEKETYGLDDPSAVVTLETGDGPVTLRVGAKEPDDGSYVVKSSESDYYVEVASTSVSTLIETGRDAFIQMPTPEPDAGGS
jgi:hypothetical protein